MIMGTSELEQIQKFIPKQAKVLTYSTELGRIHFTYEYDGKHYKSKIKATDNGVRGRRRRRVLK